MATLFEYYNTGDNGSAVQNNVNDWEAQTFTPASGHDISSVKLKMYRGPADVIGTVTAYITSTSGGEPDTSDILATGTIAGSELQESYGAAEFEEITFGSAYTLAASTKYAIVVRASAADSSNVLYWRADSSSPTYAGGSRFGSTNGGSSWSEDTARDFMFEDWGSGVPTKAENPTPSDVGKDTSINLSALIWEDGGGATSYDVFFGTVSGSLSQIATGTTAVTQSLSAYIPLDFSTIYYWRVDSINDTGTTTGDEWSFYTSVNPLTNERFGDYDETLIYDEDAGTWSSTEDTAGGRYKTQLVAVGQDDDGDGVIYYGDT